MKRMNINEYVMVKLTEEGHKILRDQHKELIKYYPPNARARKYSPPAEDKNGWSSWQLWSLMEHFGPHIRLGCNPPFETEIRIHEGYLREVTE